MADTQQSPSTQEQTNSRRLELLNFRPLRKGAGTLRGFASVGVPFGSGWLEIDDIAINQAGNDRVWARLPGKPMLDAWTGNTLKDGDGKVRYAQFLRWAPKRFDQAFSDRVAAQVCEQHPDVFDPRPQ